MNQHVLKINANNAPTTLEQLLRVVRYRGFKVDKISMNVLPQDQSLDIFVNVQSKRPIGLLESQLRKLVDIREVFVEQQQAAKVTL